MPPQALHVIERSALDPLMEVLRHRGLTPVGPTVRQGAIVLDELGSAADLPAGWTDVQDGGTYRLERRDDQAVFGHNVGPGSWKDYLFPATLRLWKANRTDNGGFEIEDGEDDPPAYALFGARSCDIHAIAVQDRTFLDGPYTDRHYKAVRERLFVIAANCGQAGGTCFCVSMNTGPKADSGFDLALTELIDERGHRFLVEVGSDAGGEVLSEIDHREATDDDRVKADAAVENAASQMGRSLDTTDIRDMLYRNWDHPRWDKVADRCLTCGNCTMVCPTCFCSTIEDVTDLTGQEAERVRKRDTCFTLDHSYIHGGSVRPSGRARYRQWMTHKLATWIDQFGTSGCVGCGRCITWCPVAIDITEEAAAIRATDKAGKGTQHADDR